MKTKNKSNKKASKTSMQPVQHKIVSINRGKGHFRFALISVIVILVLYFYVDRSASLYFNEVRHTDLYSPFFWMQDTVNMIQVAIPYIYIYLIVMLYFKHFTYLEEFLFSACNSLLIGISIKNLLKYIFGRNWTETFTHNNLSLIKDNAYGFNFFKGSEIDGSFPSGHAVMIFSVMTVLWIMYPKFRWLSVVWCIVVVVGLLGCDFHFPSDIIAGAFIGIIVAKFVIQASQLYGRCEYFKNHKCSMNLDRNEK